MIADSKYEIGDLALGPSMGFAVGAAGGFLIVGTLWLLYPVSGVSPHQVLTGLAGLLPGSGNHRGSGLVLGLAILSFAGAVCGALYGASQQLAPSRAVLVTGASYGVLLWAFGGNIVMPLLAAELGQLSRSWAWLLACLVYGLWLSGVAALFMRKRSRHSEVVQPD